MPCVAFFTLPNSVLIHQRRMVLAPREAAGDEGNVGAIGLSDAREDYDCEALINLLCPVESKGRCSSCKLELARGTSRDEKP